MTRRDLFTVVLTVAATAVAALEVINPFAAVVHTWWFALAVTISGAYLLIVSFSGVTRALENGPIALMATGGALLAACVAFAAFLIGQPQRVPAVPGQSYRPPHGYNVAIDFPEVGTSGSVSAATAWPDHVTIVSAAGRTSAVAGDTVRSGAFVFQIASGPAAYVDARAAGGQPVTITQPDGAAFLSPFLTFAGLDGVVPEDYFALPALHRNVQVDYWAGLPARGINVPFLALRIAEENGGSLYEGVAVSGRTLRKAGIALTFSIGSYPIVTASSAPPLVPFWAGVALVAAGFLLMVVRFARTRA